MGILQKNPHFTFRVASVTLPQQLSTLGSCPGSVPPCQGSMQNDHGKAPTSDCSREHPASSWPRNVQVRRFWSQTHQSLLLHQMNWYTCCAARLLTLPFVLPEARFAAPRGKGCDSHFHPSLVAQSWHTRNGNSGGKSCVMKTIN